VFRANLSSITRQVAPPIVIFFVACSLLATSNVGVVRVTPSATVLELNLGNLPSEVEIVELTPYETSANATNAPSIVTARANAPRISVPRFDGARDRLYSGFATILRVTNGSGSLLGSVRFVEDLQEISSSREPFPRAASKKGLQVQMTDDAIALGVKHAALNVNLTGLIDLQAGSNSYTWSMDGQTYHFLRGAVDAIPVKVLSDANMVVSLIILTYASDAERNRLMLHPWYDPAAPNHLGAFNTATADGLRYYKACLEFLADRYSRPDRAFGRAVNYIIGNEVNSHWHWYNLGRAPLELVAEEYLRAVRVAHTAVRKASASARVYLSLEHHWNISFEKDPMRTCAGRALVEQINQLAKLGGDFDWHLAFHPYPENLFQPRTWRDKTATASADTPRITFKNLEVLTRFLRQPELLYHGEPRHVILSEQGFHSDETPEGERAQAAAYCYAYAKIADLDSIDSFILHRHVDHKHEGGLNLGLWRRKSNSVATPDSRKPIYEVFRAADTAEREKAFSFALPVIGITNWLQVVVAP